MAAPWRSQLTLTSLFLVILASFAHATWNLFAKRAATAGPVFVCAYNIVACAAYAPVTIYEISRGRFVWGEIAIGILFLSGAIHLGYSLFLQRGYRKAELSVVYPVARGTGPMLSTIAAVLFLGEAPHALGICGLVLVVLGIGLIATQGDLSAFRRPGGQLGVRYGSQTGALIACYTVVDAYGVKTLGIAPVILDWFSNLLRFFVLAPVAIADPHGAFACLRRFWREIIAVGILSPLGYILILAALSSGAPLSEIAPMREMSMMVGTLLGMAVLKEEVGRWRIAGCGVLIGGVVLLAAA